MGASCAHSLTDAHAHAHSHGRAVSPLLMGAVRKAGIRAPESSLGLLALLFFFFFLLLLPPPVLGAVLLPGCFRLLAGGGDGRELI